MFNLFIYIDKMCGRIYLFVLTQLSLSPTVRLKIMFSDVESLSKVKSLVNKYLENFTINYIDILTKKIV